MSLAKGLTRKFILNLLLYSSLISSIFKRANKTTIISIDSWLINKKHLGDLLSYRKDNKKIIYVNLNSKINTFVVSILLGGEIDDEKIMKELMYRSIWDYYLLKGKVNLSKNIEIEGYEKQFNQFKRKWVEENKIYSKSLLRILFSDNLDFFICVQECYLDIWFAKNYAKLGGKSLNMHTIAGPSPITETNKFLNDRYNFFKLDKREDKELKLKAEHSIRNRCIGNYKESTIGFYMQNENGKSLKDPESYNPDKINIFLYCHAFTDSPNMHYDGAGYIDHYHFVLYLISILKNDCRFNLYIKFHPSSKLKYKNDRKFVEDIEGRIKKYKNIEVFESNINHIIKLFGKDWVCLTGRGSITIEAAYLGVKVLNYQDWLYSDLGVSNLLPYKISANELFEFIRKLSIDDLECKKLAIDFETKKIKSLHCHNW